MKEYEFHQLALEYRRMSEAELLRMQDEMTATGFNATFPIILYEGKILDGCNRYIAATRAGVEPVYRQFEGTEDEAMGFVSLANEERRHLTEQELSDKRRERLERIASARKEGKSLRTIAKDEKVSAMQVKRDLEVTTVTGGVTVEPPNGKVTGKDGRVRTAHPEPKNRVANHEQKEEADEPIKDAVDQDIPSGLVAIFEKAREFRDIVNQLNAINRKLQELREHPAGACLRLQEAQIDLKNLKESVRFDAPYAVCPVCNGVSKTRKANCPCKQRGWLIEGAYKNLPTEYRS